MKKIVICSIIILLHISCNKSIHFRYEGFTDSKLTVYVTEYIPQTGQNTAEKIQSILTEKCGYRAFKILACYASIHVDRKKVTPAADELLNRTVNEIIAEGKIIYSDCNDESYCEAFSEYNAKKFFDAIDTINNR